MQRQTLVDQLRAVSGFSSSLISDDDLHLLIETALNEYVGYRPGLTLTTASEGITTVAGQPNYTKPSDALWIIEVSWNPDYSDDQIINDLYLTLALETFNPQHPSELTIIFQRYAALREKFQGHWKDINDEIWLIPTPSLSGQKVAVFYATERTLDDLGDVKDSRFLRLVKAYMTERRGNDLAPSGGWRAGSYAVTGTPAAQMLSSAERQFAQVRSELANAYYAEASGPREAVKSA